MTDHGGERVSRTTRRGGERVSRTRHFLGDTAVLTRRCLRHISRSLDTIITTTIMPIVFMLLFVYVFGVAIN